MSVNVDLQALQEFIDETNESLQGIEGSLLLLEKNPGDDAIINKIFRPVHSMKGNSGFFGLSNINKFAHRMEDLLDYVRKGEIVVGSEVTNILLTGIDYLRQMLDRVEVDPADIMMRPEENTFLVEKVQACKPEYVVGSFESVQDFEDLLGEAESVGLDINNNHYITAALDQIAKYSKELRILIDQAGNKMAEDQFAEDQSYWLADKEYTEMVSPVADAARTLLGRNPLTKEQIISFQKGMKDLGGLLHDKKKVPGLLHELESLVNFFDDEIVASNREFVESAALFIAELLAHFEIRQVEGACKKRLGEILVDKQVISSEQLEQALAKQSKLGEILKDDGLISEDDLKQALDVQSSQIIPKKQSLSQSSKKEKKKFIRIDQGKLDGFADAVGELFINVDSFNFIVKKLEPADIDPDTMVKFTNAISSLDNMLANLQESVMSVRKVSVNKLFQRFPRVVRQLSGSLGKDIDFRIVGEDTVIDKDLLEAIENPMVHILRNALDHAIELPAQREKKGKCCQGLLELSAMADEYNVYLTIKDDGAGIDPVQMKKIAVEKNFLSASEVEQLTDAAAINLIFRPGFSSAGEVSDVSGRGVGMDAVMDGLDQCNGSIHVDSVVDRGTSVTITIPLTRSLVTKDALIVEVGGQLFAISSDDITTTAYPDDSVVKLLGDESGISYHNTVLRLVNADKFFFGDQPSNEVDTAEDVIVVCERHGLGLVVNKMFNHQQIVVKYFDGGCHHFVDIPGIYGYTILGNEEIVLIMDLEKIFNEVEPDNSVNTSQEILLSRQTA